MDNYIEGPHIITYRVHTSNGFSYQESMTVGCYVGYDEAYRYVCDQWGYGGDTDVEILCIEPTPAAIRDHEIEQERKREEQEREVRRRMEEEWEWRREQEREQRERASASSSSHSGNHSVSGVSRQQNYEYHSPSRPSYSPPKQATTPQLTSTPKETKSAVKDSWWEKRDSKKKGWW